MCVSTAKPLAPRHMLYQPRISCQVTHTHTHHPTFSRRFLTAALVAVAAAAWFLVSFFQTLHHDTKYGLLFPSTTFPLPHLRHAPPPPKSTLVTPFCHNILRPVFLRRIFRLFTREKRERDFFEKH